MKVYIKTIEEYDIYKLKSFFVSVLSNDTLFQRSSSFLLKPNLLQASKPEKAITTHPLFIEAIILAIKELKSDVKIFIGDSPGANFVNYDKVLNITGVLPLVDKYGLELVKFEKYKPLHVKNMIITSFIEQVDCIINLAKLKTHSLTGLTLCVKNFFGIVPGTNKVGFHRKFPDNQKLSDSIYEVYEMVKDKSISFLDGILAHEGEGPSRGKPKQLGIVAGSRCAECVDMEITKLLGFEVTFCRTNRIPFQKGVKYIVESDVEKVDKLSIPVSQKVEFLPDFVKRWFANSIYVKPKIDTNACAKCFLCYKSCPVGAIIKKSNDNLFVVEKKCVECFCCYEVCEYDAINLRRSLLHKILVRE